MSKSYRIRTTPGEGNGYLNVNVDLNQNYDFLEILSLKISQKEDYQDFCADYGVVAGRVIVNGGFGVPNVKVSIFIPVEEKDLTNPVISSIYNYQEPFPNQKNGNGIRYNVLPNSQQSLDHTPVGTFPKKREILDDNTTLEIYEKYYKYTTTTNESGDYILFGVPVGEHFLHYDMDVSDIGFLSTRPFDLINQGYSDDLFASRFKYNSSNNLDSLPQIFSENIPITVEPYWCDSLSTGSALGINRYDIEPNVKITPTSVFMGSVFSDDEKDSLNKNCKPSREMGKMNEVITSSGKIEALRRNVDGSIEKFELKEDSIDENGNWSVLLPMNIRKVVTDEFGNLIPSPDGVKGVPTEGDYRFRISMDATSNDKRLRQRAKFLVPNTNNNFVFDEFTSDELENSVLFTKNEQLSKVTIGTDYEDDLRNQYNYLEEFYPFRWKKIYTVKQYIGRLQKSGFDEVRGFIGIKDIINAEGVNKFPANRHDSNLNILYSIICIILSLFATVIGLINGIINIINGLITTLCNFKLPVFLCFGSSDKGSKYKLKYKAYTGPSCNVPIPAGTPGVPTTIGFSEIYDRATGLTGDNNEYDEGSFDGFLGECDSSLAGLVDGTREYYPAKTIDNKLQPVTQNGDEFNTGVCAPPGTKVADFLDANGNNEGACVQSDITIAGSPVFYKLAESGSWRNSIRDCTKDNIDDDCSGIKIFGICIQIQYWCLFGGIFCKRCKASCPGDPDHDCNLGLECGGGLFGCCSDCCVKIPLIPLRCAETGEQYVITLIPTPFGARLCNRVFVAPFTCSSCGGPQTPGIKDWLSCVLEPVAVFLKMLKFDFYNDWVGGSLYFPLIKRKYKLKKSKRKFGQIKKDKFCDYECKIRGEEDFQGNPTYKQWRIKIPFLFFNNPQITIDGCTAKVRGLRSTEWYGTLENDDEIDNLNLAVKELEFLGSKNSGEFCKIVFNTYSDFNQKFTLQNGIPHNVKDRDLAGLHGKPEYVQTQDSTGFGTWENIGGHGHHRNICDNTRLMERKEYFKTSLDCEGEPTAEDLPENNELVGGEDGFEEPISEDLVIDSSGQPVDPQPEGPPPLIDPALGFCPGNSCDSKCGFNGVAPCKNTNGEKDVYDTYKDPIIEHGLISWYEGEIYYTPYMPVGDLKENKAEYKANFLLPTTIMELGSMSFCDIDDVPFLINQVEPTTFKVSSEDFKTKINPNESDYLDGIKKEIKKFDDKKDSSLNLSAYIEFSCFSVVCANISGIVNQSQIGVEIIDKNDIGVEAGTCYLRFDHDEDLRQYFCRRFNGYKSDRTFHHTNPYSNIDDNVYNTYPEITLNDGYNLYYGLPDNGPTILSEYNDGDSFISGDACGYNEQSGPDYFYGLAPGATQNFINYPNSDTTNNANGTINFGNPPIEETVGDPPNDTNVSGIRFNRSQTPYHLYFGIVPGKTALHKTVSKFFADKINSVTLQGLGKSNSSVNENINNTPKIGDGEQNNFTVYKTCLGETLIQTVNGN